MVETIMLAILSFALGVVFFQAVKWLSGRPKGYVRLGHNGAEERSFAERRSPSRKDDVSPVRSKFDYLFNYKSKKNTTKINLEDVEKSYRPEPRANYQAVRSGGEIKNNYIDLSSIEDNRHSSVIDTQFNQPPQSFFQAPVSSEPTNPSLSFPQSNFSQDNSSAGSFFTPASPPVQTQPPVAEQLKPRKDEKERDWRPMGFFDE